MSSSSKISLTVKTLDSTDHQYGDLDEDEMSVKDLKVHIASDVNIPADRQRLIYCGRVLQDDKKLKDYKLNGKALHLVSRTPPSINGGPDNVAASEARARSRRPHNGGAGAHGVNVMIHHGSTIRNLDENGGSLTSPSARLNVANRMLRQANILVDRMENPNTTTAAAASPASASGASSTAATTTTTVTTSDSEIGEATGGESGVVSVAAIPIGTMTIQFEHSIPPSASAAAADGASTIGGGANTTTSSSTTSPNFAMIPQMMQAEMLQQRLLRRAQHQVNETSTDEGVASSAPLPTTIASSTTTASTESSTANSGRNSDSNGAQAEIEYPPTRTMADVMDAYRRTSDRLSSHWDRLSSLLRNDPELTNVRDHQVFYNNITQAMHYMSHAQHALSDIMVNFSTPPARVLRARPVVNIVRQSFVTNGPRVSVSAPTVVGSAVTVSTAPSAPRPQTEAMETGEIGFSVEAEPIMVGIEIPANASSSENSTGTENGSPASSSDGMNPPVEELFQNVLHSTLHGIHQALHRSTAPASRPNESPHSGARTQPTTSTRTRSSPQVYYATTSNLGGGPGQHPVNQCFDFFLQCESHHLPGGGGGSGASGRWPFDHHHTIRRRTRHPAGFQVHHSRSSSVPPHQATNNTSSTSSASAQSSPTVIRRRQQQQQQQPAVPIIEPSLSGLINQIINPNNSVGGSNTDDQMMLTMIQGVLRNVVGALGLGLPPTSGNSTSGNQTVEQFLSSLPDYDYVAGESFVTDLLMTLARHSTFRDLVSWVFGGGDAILNQLHGPLREFIHSQLGGSVTEASIQRLVDEWYPEMEEVTSVATVKPGIDFSETLHSFSSARVASLIRFIDDEATPNFGRDLSTMVRDMAIDATALGLHCFTDGPASLERVVQNRLVALCDDGLGPMVREWTMSVATGHLRNYIAGLEQSSADVNVTEFVVHVGAEADTRKADRNAANRPSESSAPPDEDHFETPRSSPDLIEDPVIVASVTMDDAVPSPIELNQRFPASLLPTLNSPTVSTEEAWHRALPVDWVPIITRDLSRQQSLVASTSSSSSSDDERIAQSPYSDAYLSSQPAKRRKLASSMKPERNTGLESIIVESLNEALEETGVAIHTDTVENVATNRDVCNSVEIETQKIIKKKLEKDPDFAESSSDRFPASKSFLLENKED